MSSENSSSSNSNANYMRSYMISPKQMPRAKTIATPADHGFQRNGRAWFVATELQSDLNVEVGDISFNLHKFPLLSRSGRLNRLVFESRDTQNDHIRLPDMPGGPEAFVLASKFCYGIPVDLTAHNVAALRCASEYLEMTEDLGEGNLISKTETFLSFVVLASWKDSITVLRGCDHGTLFIWAEKLHIIRRCCESIAWKACTDPRGISWAYTRSAASGEYSKDGLENLSTLSNSTSTASTTITTFSSHHQQHHDDALDDQASEIGKRKKKIKDVYMNNAMSYSMPMNNSNDQVPQDWWVEDLLELSPHCFVKVMHAIKSKGMNPDIVGGALVRYGLKWVPGLSSDHDQITLSKDKELKLTLDEKAASGFNMRPNSNGHHSGSFDGSSSEEGSNSAKKDRDCSIQSIGSMQGLKHTAMVEGLVGLLPNEKDLCSYRVPCGFLLRLLRIGNMLGVSAECRREMERRIGLQLEEANVGDLLIPSLQLVVAPPKVEEHHFEGHEAGQAAQTVDGYPHHMMFDVDLVHRLVTTFVSHLDHDHAAESCRTTVLEPSRAATARYQRDRSFEYPRNLATTATTADHVAHSHDGHVVGDDNSKLSTLNRVAKLLDGYLAEVAQDPHLPISKFRALAEMLPDSARSCHDGLYRAIDTYLKAHPMTGDIERRQLSGVMDCRKLSLNACTHAVQNERLPLRLVVQILFHEHIKLQSVTTTMDNRDYSHVDHGSNKHAHLFNKKMDDNLVYDPQSPSMYPPHGAYHVKDDALACELHLLKVDMELVKAKYVELSADYAALHRLLFQSSSLSNIHKANDHMSDVNAGVVSHITPQMIRPQLNIPRPMSGGGGRRMSGLGNGLRKLGHLFTSRMTIDSESVNNSIATHEPSTSNQRFGRRRRNSMS